MLKAKDIVIDSNKKIREKSNDVDIPLSQSDKKLAEALLEYVLLSTIEEDQQEKQYKPAVGLAAIQVGVPKKILAIAYSEEEDEKEVEVRYLLANAKIIRNSVRLAYLKSGEGCLSVEEVHEGYTMRYNKIKVKAYDILNEKEVVIDATGYLAIVLQHEIDHFNGILYYDHIKKENPFYIPSNSVEV